MKNKLLLFTKTKMLKLVTAIIFFVVLCFFASKVRGYEQASQREWFLTEHEYAARELYYSIIAWEYGNKRQLMRVIKRYNDCFYFDVCN